jgi:hypothetical protein
LPVTINASRFNDLYSQVEQILGPATSATYDWDSWYDEYKTTYWSGAAKSTVLAYKDFVLNLYESNDAFSTSLGTRYGLFRKAKALGVAYWVNDLTNGVASQTLINNFFYSASLSTFVQSDGQTDAQRSLTSSKSFLYSGVGTVVSDRGVAGYGYGQTLLSSPVIADTDIIEDNEYIDLYKDIVRIDAHQNGSSITIDPFVVGDYATNLASTDKVEEVYIAGLESKVASLETTRFNIDIGAQANIVPLYLSNGTTQLSSSRSLVWRTTVSHIFTVDFGSETSLDSFFNAGGQVRCALSIAYTGSQIKTKNWQTLLSTLGQIAISIDKVTDSTGLTTTKGYEDLSTSYTRIYTSGSAVSYSNNRVVIDALKVNSQKIQIKLSCQDAHSEVIDEYVQGTLSSSMFLAVPSGSILINGETIDTVVYDESSIIGATTSNF